MKVTLDPRIRIPIVTTDRVNIWWKLVEEVAKGTGIDYGRFREVLVSGEGPVYEASFGIMRVDGIEDGKGNVHGFFWSKDVFGEVGMIRGLVLYNLIKYGLRALYCKVPNGSRGVKRLLSRIGFRFVAMGEESVYRIKVEEMIG